jgi:hypothetical protein
VKAAIVRVDPEIRITPHAQALDPAWAIEYATAPRGPGLDPVGAVWINHHDALHSRWQPDHVMELRRRGIKVLLTYHDTRERIEDTPKLQMLVPVVDHTIVHEPVQYLTDNDQLEGAVTYLRQGVPARPGQYALDWRRLGGWPRPVLGTVGFDFPWKNYTRLAELTAEIGWGLLLICPNLTPERVQELRAINPWLTLPEDLGAGELHVSGIVPTDTAVSILAACTATAFMYECANTGTSGAIRLGIATRKPVYALETCRQFRDLRMQDADDQIRTINWVHSWHVLRQQLIASWSMEVDPAMVYLAERDSMAKVGARYALTLRGL